MANLADRLADGVKDRGVKLAYGAPVTLGEDEAVPVSLVFYGFGGGNGSDSEGNGGEGGGGGGAAIPVGAYTASPEGPVFVPNLIALLGVSIPLVCAGGWALARVIKAFK
ncbi:MAG: hypothetical protein JWR36_428 [Glaciihabitans sp.]|jgi:hypothetical protein|nr:hypothetical protein [Glaciihabitans sp.]MDQ1569601.1 hypothetical protein [Actinomycetota bacterium]